MKRGVVARLVWPRDCEERRRRTTTDLAYGARGQGRWSRGADLDRRTRRRQGAARHFLAWRHRAQAASLFRVPSTEYRTGLASHDHAMADPPGRRHLGPRLGGDVHVPRSFATATALVGS
jgi:hypothetical protein